MRVLFVCRANVGRSQMAMEFYNKLHPGSAASAGTMVDIPGQKLKDRETAVGPIITMKELGIDMSENIRTQLIPEMLNDYDEIVVMSEPESTPEYLKTNPKVENWRVEDAMGKSLEKTKKIRDQIKKKVEMLASES